MKMKFILVFLFFCCMFSAIAQHKMPADSVMAIVAKGKPYTLVFLKSGKKIPTKSQAAQQMQIDHLTKLFNLEREGKISIFGPLVNDPKLRGIIVFNTTDKESVKNELKNDPYIKAGYLKFELLDWFSIPGQRIK